MENLQVEKKRRRLLRVVAFSAICVIINLLGSQLAGLIDFPLFLDSIGTVLSAAVSGYLPGIAVGLVTNVINSLSDPSTIYYSALNVMIAMCTAFFYHRGLLKKLYSIILYIILLAAIGGGLGSVLTWFIFGFAGEGISANFALDIYQNTGMPMFLCQISADMVLDIIDKAIVVVVVLIVLKLIPEKFKKKLQYEGWQQTPLDEEHKHRISKSSCRSISLRTKILLLLAASSVVLSIVATAIGYLLFTQVTFGDHRQFCEGVATIAASMIDPDKVDEYIALGEDAEGYTEIEDKLYTIRESSPDIRYIYAYKIEDGGCRVVFDLDTEDVKGNEPGDLMPFEEAFSDLMDDLKAGRPIEPLIVNESFGWLMTSYVPVYNDDGECVCYAGADVSMDDLRTNGYAFLAKQISLFLGFFLLIMAVGLWLAEYNIVLPVNSMAHAADAFAYNSEQAREHSVEGIKQLQINTGDEIENLYSAFSHTTQESMDFVTDIQKKTETISHMQVGLIYVLADIIESRDKNTGDHIKKTAAYIGAILEELRDEGLYTDILTDKYIEDIVNSAPLHDIGKIRVPDAVLSNPGKLSDEDYNKIKMHTVWGAEIIEQAIATVPDSDFLKYAKELALCHHEKWNGTGYPRGLKGEEIPMAARAMAIADVFDALVSRRSYKEPLSVDATMKIIEEGSGEHFDPVMVKAFLNIKEKVRKISEDFEVYNNF